MVLVLETGRSWVGSLGLVDLTFFLASLSWHFAVARLFGRCFDISSAVSPGHVEKLPLLIAVINVLGTGEKAARWQYIARSGFVAMAKPLFAK